MRPTTIIKKKIKPKKRIVIGVGWPMLLISGAIVLWNRPGGCIIQRPRRWRGCTYGSVRYRVVLEEV
jgi:hypothetical protein